MLWVPIHLRWPVGPTSHHKYCGAPVGQRIRQCASDSGKTEFN